MLTRSSGVLMHITSLPNACLLYTSVGVIVGAIACAIVLPAMKLFGKH